MKSWKAVSRVPVPGSVVFNVDFIIFSEFPHNLVLYIHFGYQTIGLYRSAHLESDTY